jgi:hypothetical protein
VPTFFAHADNAKHASATKSAFLKILFRFISTP